MTNYGQNEIRRMEKNRRRQERLQAFFRNGFVRFLGLILAGLVALILLITLLGTPDAFPCIIPFH